MKRKRAVKLLMSATAGGERVYVGELMDLDRYKGKTNAEKLKIIAFELAVLFEFWGFDREANRCKKIAMRVRSST